MSERTQALQMMDLHTAGLQPVVSRFAYSVSPRSEERGFSFGYYYFYFWFSSPVPSCARGERLPV
jgi:hypothetical protein